MILFLFRKKSPLFERRAQALAEDRQQLKADLAKGIEGAVAAAHEITTEIATLKQLERSL